MKLFPAVAVLLTAATLAWTADPAVDDLFKHVREKVLNSSKRVPRYTCVENITRAQYKLPLSRRAGSCGMLIQQRAETQNPGAMLWRDRVRLDVAVVEGVEMFSWAGGGKFETDSVSSLVGTGTSGSGDFIAFLQSVFGNETDSISYLGLQKNLAAFAYNVPLSKSHYSYRTKGPSKVTGYHGSFFIDPAAEQLERLVVETSDFGVRDEVCHAENAMDYRTMKFGESEFLMPEVTTMKVLFSNGEESANETRYSDCREYVGESTIHYDDVDVKASAVRQAAALPPLPPGVRLQIALDGTVNTETAAAGDAITGTLTSDARDGKRGIVAHRNDKLRGRILRMGQDMYPTPRWVVELRFETIERGGVEQPVHLKAAARGAGAAFVFKGAGNVVLDRKLISEWETVE